MVNEGFFKGGELKRFKKYKPLPPVLNLDPFEYRDKPKKEKTIVYNEKQLVMDIESYINYCLVNFSTMSGEKVYSFEQFDDTEFDYNGIEAILKKYEIITFKGNTFDALILNYILTGATNKEIKEACNDIIKNKLRAWQFEEKHNLPELKFKHIDLEELTPGVALPLKLYGGRLHCPKLQDLPYPENAKLTESQIEDVAEYCDNDLALTRTIAIELNEQIELRRTMSKRYKLDLLSKSDAQIAEAVISSEVGKLKGEKLEKREISKSSFLYKAPSFISFSTEKLKKLLKDITSERFIIEANGRISMPEELNNLEIKIGSSVYSVGMGGLHSTEKVVYHVADENHEIVDWDVTSYYPSIILNCGLYPKQLGKEFLEVYENIVEERIEAKEKGEKTKADSLKITINGSFGKLGSPYSILYAPELMIQVTVTGQLSLLMLIEMMENESIAVVSGNTDGIVIKCLKDKLNLMDRIIEKWEKITGFTMESTEYLGLFSRDVNNYIAVKKDGSVKVKGCFAFAGLNKNPENEICNLAMIDYIRYGTPFEKTIRNCKDITKFVTVRRVNGGATKDGKYIGKVIRWYYAKGEKGIIQYSTNGNKVPDTNGAKPIMDISISFPEDVDYEWYIHHCKELFE